MKILVTGASGLLGRAICRELHEYSCFKTVGTAYSRTTEDLVMMNVLERRQIESCIEKVRPDCIIHCAATRKPDICEKDPDLTTRLNVNATKWIAAGASKIGAWMIHISTDYVFDGTDPPYRPDSKPNPLNAYGKSKLQSEMVMPKILKDFCILRVPILYGQIESLDESPVTVIANQLLAGREQKFDNWSTRYPTHTGDVAFVLRQIIEHKRNNPTFGGICHWSGNEAYTKFRMAQVISDIMNIPKQNVTGQDTPAPGAIRPKNTHLDCTLLESLGIGRHTKFAKGVADSVKPFLAT
ncbi:MAG: SDR family oxidoreductase [Planctomycetes bacterium]|nr:SDR family oxidoreductase [Planctomycetota bacterium]